MLNNLQKWAMLALSIHFTDKGMETHNCKWFSQAHKEQNQECGPK